jgi:hypothetical protein
MPNDFCLTENPVVAPTKAIELVTNLTGELCDRVLEGYAPEKRICKRFAEAEAHALLLLIIRNAETVCYLAQIDLGMFPGAISAARTCFEVAVRGLWMLQPTTAEEREGRWLAHLESEEDHARRLAKRLSELGSDPGNLPALADALKQRRLGIKGGLPPAATKHDRAPNLEQMLRSLDTPIYYANYMRLSQYVHGTAFATRLYRRRTPQGTEELGEFLGPRDWYNAFGATGIAVRSFGDRIISLHGDDPAKFLPRSFLQRFQSALNHLAKDE